MKPVVPSELEQSCSQEEGQSTLEVDRKELAAHQLTVQSRCPH